MITGAHGFVGARAMQRYPHAMAVPSPLVRQPGELLAEAVRAYAPHVILNMAAISDIRACEMAPQASYTANVTLPVVLAKAAREVGAKLVSFSSDQVYTGCRGEGPYSECDELPTPANVYAVHKLEAEGRVLDANPDAVLLRATWMYDMPMPEHVNRGNFLVNVLGALMRRQPMCLSDMTYRGITYVRQVVRWLDDAMKLAGGVYNYGSETTVSMWDTAMALSRVLGMESVAEEVFMRQSTTAHNLWMRGDKLRRCGIVFDSTVDGFERCAQDYALLRV